MRTGTLVLIILLGSALAPGTAPTGMAEEKEKQLKPPSAWDWELLKPIAHAEATWRKRAVRIERVRVFPRQLVLTLRAPARADLDWALLALATRPLLKPRIASSGRWAALCQPTKDGKWYEVDVLIDAQQFKPPGARVIPPSLRTKRPSDYLAEKVKRSARYVDMHAKTQESSVRRIEGESFESAVLTCKPSTAGQFTKLLYNLASWGDIFIATARWDRKRDGKEASDLIGPSIVEVLKFKSE